MEIFANEDDLIKEWESFTKAVKKNPTVRTVTMEAWKRCRDLGLKPENIKFKILSPEELQKKIDENSQLIEIAKPYLSHLSLSLTGIPHLIILTDNYGWIIDCEGTIEELGGRNRGLCLGASWAEKDVGNNGAGTALVIGKPVLIYGMEHFNKVCGPFTCVGVPIIVNGKIIGSLDVAVPNKYAHPARLNLTIACVNSIQTTMADTVSHPFGMSSDVSLSAASELIATAVHDLKNPLAVIRGLGQLGKLTSDKNKINAYFDKVIKQADELNTMVVELLSIFRPQEILPMKINPIVKEVIEEFQPECEAKGISLKFIDEYDRYANISEMLFRRVIRNLVANAFQASSENDFIEVKIEEKEQAVLISIKDTAGGIPEEIKDTLFQPFTFRRSGGTGLGLFMVYHAITNTHRGEIWFETKTGRGTTFFIQLPAASKEDISVNKKYKLI
ncbi:GAF domain-containing protein [Clostridium sp. 19966]|uniref:ATP-binding protein n=1 Tax=Clostridium sp. 19966 TaxID=2768166 RepID=UPI0028E089A3|nr:ATP-binding protein [Clostridium sp. 19966]MDT8718473.1 GAF domain-containing protein [Clostridium sp. 19966]